MFDSNRLHPLHIDSSVTGYSLNHAYVCAVAAWLAYFNTEQLSGLCANTGLIVEQEINIPPNFCIVLRSNGVRIIAFRGTDETQAHDSRDLHQLGPELQNVCR